MKICLKGNVISELSSSLHLWWIMMSYALTPSHTCVV